MYSEPSQISSKAAIAVKARISKIIIIPLRTIALFPMNLHNCGIYDHFENLSDVFLF